MRAQPLMTAAEHGAALEEVERLMNAQLGTPEGDRLDILVAQVDDYEARHETIEPPDSIDALRYHMESRGLARRALQGSTHCQDGDEVPDHHREQEPEDKDQDHPNRTWKPGPSH